jgi:urease accessory protein
VCQAILIHPPGGIAGGDVLDVQLKVTNGAHAQITTPGAGKWYRSADLHASQSVHIRVASDAICEWLPQENIFFAGARARMSWSIELDAGAVFCGWEMSCLGRPAAEELFDNGVVRQSTRVEMDGRCQYFERINFSGQDEVLWSAPMLGGHVAFGTMIVAGRLMQPALLETCRMIHAAPTDQVGVTAMDQMVVARWLGASAQEGRNYFAALWRAIRPWLCRREAIAPRIWRT